MPEPNYFQEIDIVNIEDLELTDIDTIQKEDAIVARGVHKNSAQNEFNGQTVDREISSARSFTVEKNTDPNNAYFLPLNEPSYGTITAQGELRWFGTEISQRSKLTTTLHMNGNTDFDLAIFKLDTDTMVLNFVTESYLGTGSSEIIDSIVEPGIYYFLVSSYIGTGPFELTAYTSNSDIQYELNENTNSAHTVADNNFTLNGVIDNPYDYDYYKFNITGTRVSKFNLTRPTGTNYAMYLILNGTSAYEISSNASYDIPAGTHYIVVFSKDGTFTGTSPYTLKLTSENYIPGLVATSDGTHYLQVSADRKDYYVNGNFIDFSWSYTTSVNNSAGWINMYMNLYKKSNQFVAMFESELAAINYDGELPYFANYSTNFEGGGSAYPALMLTLINTDFRVNRYAGGEYSHEAIHYTVPYTQVVVNPNTGEIIDVTFYNFYYYFGYRDYTIRRVSTVYNYETMQ